jgi:hypothetical protein
MCKTAGAVEAATPTATGETHAAMASRMAGSWQLFHARVGCVQNHKYMIALHSILPAGETYRKSTNV